MSVWGVPLNFTAKCWERVDLFLQFVRECPVTQNSPLTLQAKTKGHASIQCKALKKKCEFKVGINTLTVDCTFYIAFIHKKMLLDMKMWIFFDCSLMNSNHDSLLKTCPEPSSVLKERSTHFRLFLLTAGLWEESHRSVSSTDYILWQACCVFIALQKLLEENQNGKFYYIITDWIFNQVVPVHEITLNQLYQHVATEMKVTWYQAQELTIRIRPKYIGHAKNMALHLALIDTLIRLQRMCPMNSSSNEYLSSLQCMVSVGQTHL